MGRKGTARANKIKPPARYLFEIGISNNDKTQKIDVEGTRIETDMEELHIYDIIHGKEEKVGSFRDWAYFVMLDSYDEIKENPPEN